MDTLKNPVKNDATEKEEIALSIRVDRDLYNWIKANAHNERRSINAQVGLTLKKAKDLGVYPLDPNLATEPA